MAGNTMARTGWNNRSAASIMDAIKLIPLMCLLALASCERKTIEPEQFATEMENQVARINRLKEDGYDLAVLDQEKTRVQTILDETRCDDGAPLNELEINILDLLVQAENNGQRILTESEIRTIECHALHAIADGETASKLVAISILGGLQSPQSIDALRKIVLSEGNKLFTSAAISLVVICEDFVDAREIIKKAPIEAEERDWFFAIYVNGKNFRELRCLQFKNGPFANAFNVHPGVT